MIFVQAQLKYYSELLFNSSSAPAPSPLLLLSVGVEGGSEDDVPADGQGGLLHLAPQD